MPDTPSTLRDSIYPLFRGTVTGGLSSWITLPLDFVYKVYSFDDNKKKYGQLYKQVFTWQELKDLNTSYWTTGFRAAVLKAVTNGGMLSVVDAYAKKHPMPPKKKGAMAAVLCAPTEAVSITPGLIAQTRSFVTKEKRNFF